MHLWLRSISVQYFRTPDSIDSLLIAI